MANNNEKNLKQIFQEALDLYNAIETTNDPLNSPHVQVRFNKILIGILTYFILDQY